MKRLLAFILVIATLSCTLLSCASSSLTAEETKTAEDTVTKADSEEKKESTPDKGEIVYPEGFSVDFGRVDISPPLPVTIDSYGDGLKGEILREKLYATCVAVCDGETVALMFSMDMKQSTASVIERLEKDIEKKLGIPASNVTFTATHTHNAPIPTVKDDPSNIKWLQTLYKMVPQAAEEALRDLAPAQIYTGRGDTTGMGYVRRYLMADGSYKGIHSGNPAEEYVGRESVADPELRTVRFERGDKKDILMVNWQCHAASSASDKISGKYVVSADFIAPMREGVEKNLDVHFAYYNGASGNITFTTKLPGEKKYANNMACGEALVGVIEGALKDETQVNSGKVQVQTTIIEGQVRTETKERIEQANLALNAIATEGLSNKELFAKYGFNSKRDCTHTISRGSEERTISINLTAIRFGDIGFAGAPYEMFDTNGKQIRDASPCQTTISCGYTDGSLGYLPSEEAFPHGQYEVYACKFVSGTGEICARKLVELLNYAN